MMSYLVRRENFADGTPPPKKPYNALDFKKKTDTLLQSVYGTEKSSNGFLVDLMQKELNKAVSDGVVTMEEGIDFIKDRKKFYDDYIKEQNVVLPRSNFFKGALADTEEGKAMSPGTTATGGFRDGDKDGEDQVEVTPPPIRFNQTPDFLNNRFGFGKDITKNLGLKFSFDPRGLLDKDIYGEPLEGGLSYKKGDFNAGIGIDQFGDPYANVAFRKEFSEGTKTKLVEFVENFKKAKGTAPTIMEIAKGTKSSTTSVRKYLKEGDDFKVSSYIESGKKAGDASAAKKNTGVYEVDQEAFDDLKKITKDIKGISIQSTGTKSKSAGLRIGDQYKELMDTFLDGQKTKYFPADKDGINKLKDLITQIADSPEYQKNVTPFLTSKEKLAIKRAKAAMYKKQDPYGIYRALREYKTEKFPGTMSKDVVIQHGQPKFTTQTLSRFGLIPSEINTSPIVEKIEGQRNELLTKLNQKLKSKNISIEDKKILIEDYNSKMKGLRSQLKGSSAQGLVNFELLNIDEKGNVKKSKDISFDPKKGMAYGSELGDLDLSKITKEQANQIIELGKKKIDLELLKKIQGVTTADKVEEPEKSKIRNMFDSFNQKIKNAGNAYRSIRPGIDAFTTMFPGKADNALAAAIDFPMMYMSGAPFSQAAASAGSMFMNNPNIGKMANVALEQAALSEEEQFLKNAMERRQGLESMLEKIPARFRETIEENKGVKDETETYVP